MDTERRKKLVIPVVLLLGIFIGGVVVLRTQGIGAQVLTEGKKVLFPIASEPDADPDGDGLKNWQEETYKTDPRNPDTDGDGYLDGEEVASGYNPAIPAPNDALEGTDTSAPRQAPKNLTLHLAQILTQKISAGEFEPAEGSSLAEMTNDQNLPYNQDIMNEALVQIGLRAKQYFTPIEISDNEVSILETSASDVATLLYLSQFHKIANEPMNEIGKLGMREVDMLKQTIESKDTHNISIYISESEKALEKIKKLEVPHDLVAWHKQMVSALTTMIKIFSAVKNFEEDPALAAAALESYPLIIDRLQVITEGLQNHAPSQ